MGDVAEHYALKELLFRGGGQIRSGNLCRKCNSEMDAPIDALARKISLNQ